MFRLYFASQVWSTDDVNTTLLFKDNFELTRQNNEQTVFPVKNLIEINNNLLLGEKTFRFSCELLLKFLRISKETYGKISITYECDFEIVIICQKYTTIVFRYDAVKLLALQKVAMNRKSCSKS